MLIAKLFFLSLVSLATTDLRVMFFTMDSCPPCKQTEPGIDRLHREGVAVSKIDIRQHQQYAAQCQVRQTPTIIIADGNQVVARHTGAMSYTDLRRMLDSAAPRQPVADAPQQPAVSAVSTPVSTPVSTAAGGHATQNLTPQQRAHQATVRFRVEDREGTSFATGTVVHRVDNEALVVTCGHVFRESQGQGTIHADLGFTSGQPTTVVGKLLFYDADDHDIALVAIPCPLPIQPVPVAPEGLAVQTGDRIFSFGCDRGSPPSLRSSVLKAVTRYSGVAKYDIVGRPVDGRSGGGLFSAGGQLIGVCNAAAVEVDEGIYTGLQSMYWQFAKTNLTHLFRRDAVPSRLSFEQPTQIAESSRPQATERLAAATPPPTDTRLPHPAQRHGPATGNVIARNDELNPPVAPAVFRGSEVPVQSAIYRGNDVPLRQASQPVAGQPPQNSPRHGHDPSLEVIVLVRSKTDPERTETITISNPDEQTMAWVQRARDRHRGAARRQPLDDRLARLPHLEAVNQRSSEVQMRAQSPR